MNEILNKQLDTCRGAVQTVGRMALGAAQSGMDIAHSMFGQPTYEDLRYRSNHDTLTRTYTRYGLAEAVSRVSDLNDLPKYMGIFIDVIDLSELNNRYSQAMGDNALKIVSWVANDMLRLPEEVSTRRAASRSLVGRWGGDEFLALFPLGESFGSNLASDLVYEESDSGRGDATTQQTIRIDLKNLSNSERSASLPQEMKQSMSSLLDTGTMNLGVRYDIGPLEICSGPIERTLEDLAKFMEEHGSKYVRNDNY